MRPTFHAEPERQRPTTLLRMTNPDTRLFSDTRPLYGLLLVRASSVATGSIRPPTARCGRSPRRSPLLARQTLGAFQRPRSRSAGDGGCRCRDALRSCQRWRGAPPPGVDRCRSGIEGVPLGRRPALMSYTLVFRERSAQTCRSTATRSANPGATTIVTRCTPLMSASLVRLLLITGCAARRTALRRPARRGRRASRPL